MALVVKGYYASNTPNANGNYVEIRARQPGFLAWILSLLKIDPTIVMLVTYNELVYQATTLAGYQKTLVTTGSISSSFYGYHRPIRQTIYIFAFFVMLGFFAERSGSLLAAFLLLVVGAGIAALYYAFNKHVQIGFSEVNGRDYAMVLKRSVIENVEINEDQMKFVADIISTVLRENRNMGNIGAAPLARSA
jgi:hypothetical protein